MQRISAPFTLIPASPLYTVCSKPQAFSSFFVFVFLINALSCSPGFLSEISLVTNIGKTCSAVPVVQGTPGPSHARPCAETPSSPPLPTQGRAGEGVTPDVTVRGHGCRRVELSQVSVWLVPWGWRGRSTCFRGLGCLGRLLCTQKTKHLLIQRPFTSTSDELMLSHCP